MTHQWDKALSTLFAIRAQKSLRLRRTELQYAIKEMREVDIIVSLALDCSFVAYSPRATITDEPNVLGALREYMLSNQTREDFYSFPYNVQALIYFASDISNLRLTESDVLTSAESLTRGAAYVALATKTSYLTSAPTPAKPQCAMCREKPGFDNLCDSCYNTLYEMTQFRCEDFTFTITPKTWLRGTEYKSNKDFTIDVDHWRITKQGDMLSYEFCAPDKYPPCQLTLPFVEYQRPLI